MWPVVTAVPHEKESLHIYAEVVTRVAERARRIRLASLRMVHAAGMGHPGGDLSCADILATLFFHVLRLDPAHPHDPERDRFMLSKGHASGRALRDAGRGRVHPATQLETYMQPLSMLNGHPDRNKVPGVETNTGPLGHGLPVGVGMALAAKMDHADWRTFVLTGDGELQEGSNWEAAMAAAHLGLDNLTVIVDRNRLQQGDRPSTRSTLEPLAERWRAFGWAVAEVDGHDIEALARRRSTAVPRRAGQAECVIAHTHKGRGVSFIEDRVEWHHRVPTDDELAAAVAELDGSRPLSAGADCRDRVQPRRWWRSPRPIRASSRWSTTRSARASSTSSSGAFPSGWSMSASPSRTWSASAPGSPTAARSRSRAAPPVSSPGRALEQIKADLAYSRAQREAVRHVERDGLRRARARPITRSRTWPGCGRSPT